MAEATRKVATKKSTSKIATKEGTPVKRISKEEYQFSKEG